MNTLIEQHRIEFLSALRSGEYDQAQETLVAWAATEEPAYCCLGLGSLLAGCGYTSTGGFIYHIDRAYEREEARFDTLPGPELFDWLGIDVEANQMPMGSAWAGDWSADEGKDIYLDLELDVRTTDGVQPEKKWVTLAQLNDWGCTFEQIADMIEYFGYYGDHHE